jgi:acyl-CoA thioesterase YciA
MSTEILQEPQGEIVFRSIAMPADTNANGDVFGGWLLSQMDLGGSMLAKKYSGQRVVTVALETLNFLHPVKVGDIVTCYGNIIKVGNTSIKIDVATWVCRYHTQENYLVTHGVFTYVAIDDNNKPTPIKKMES